VKPLSKLIEFNSKLKQQVRHLRYDSEAIERETTAKHMDTATQAVAHALKWHYRQLAMGLVWKGTDR